MLAHEHVKNVKKLYQKFDLKKNRIETVNRSEEFRKRYFMNSRAKLAII